jgi:tryptophan synthase alpha chain
MTTQRIDEAFARARAENRAVLVSYLMGGDPDLETSFQAMQAIASAGADIIELGAPFTDPMADGPAIQQAGIRALAAGTRLVDVLALAQRFRQTNTKTPLILMGYANPIFHLGFERFAAEAAQAGIDGVITVDLPPEEDGPLHAQLTQHGLSVIRLATPTSTPERLVSIGNGSSGFVYFVAVTGVTGAASADPVRIAPGIAEAKRVTGQPVCVGFGVKTGAQAAEMAKIADGVVVGSAYVELVRFACEAKRPERAPESMGNLTKTLVEAIAKTVKV